ncbi:MAG: hypothetical protein JW828_02615 [Sedimentisphaerales bacterium]|nr:hypothetical protein [Sedimentisphaerales bacterium]
MLHHNKETIGIWIICLALLCPGFGTTARGDDISLTASQAEIMTPVKKRMQQRISVDFRETPIEDVLRVLARQADVDVVKSPKVSGSVTATLTDIPLAEALNNILTAHGYGYIATENMIRVVPQEDIFEAREKVVSRVYRITYADVTELELALKKFISPAGSISANPTTSNIIVTDMESKITAIDAFLQEIDRITPQIMVEARIYDISSTNRMDIGVEWSVGRNTNYGANGIGSLGDSSTLASANNRTDPHMTGLFSGVTSKATDTEGLIRFGWLNNSIDIDAILRAKQEDLHAKLLANPRVMVIDNEMATIKITEEIPFQELTETSAGGSIGTTRFKDVGVELLVTPHLTRDNMIRLKIHPKFSVRTGDVVLPGVANSSPQPIVAKRETQTTTLVKDGQTVVIGGLRRQQISSQTNKVPLLGDIPLLGEVFKFHGESTVNSELVVFITPYLILQPTLSPEEQAALSNTEVPDPSQPSIIIKQDYKK